MLPLSDSVELFAKLGYYDAELAANVFSADADENESGFAAGLGINPPTGLPVTQTCAESHPRFAIVAVGAFPIRQNIGGRKRTTALKAKLD